MTLEASQNIQFSKESLARVIECIKAIASVEASKTHKRDMTSKKQLVDKMRDIEAFCNTILKPLPEIEEIT